MTPAIPDRTSRRSRLRALVATGSILLLVAPALALPAAAAQPASLPAIGITTGDIGALRAAGAPPGYASYWAGEWMAQHGWGGFNNAMKTAKANGVTPVVYWYYWGDSISPACVESGCNSRDMQEWLLLTDQLAAQLRTTMGGSEVIVVLENEFNKGGITGDYAPTFDSHLAGVAKTLKGVPGVKIVIGYGAWGESSWEKFPKTLALSDYVGYQMMRASTRDSEASYRAAAERSVYFSDFIAKKFNKPSFLYDVALSSYPDARWEKIQAETLDAMLGRLTTSGNTGLKGVVYRELTDHWMDPKNYYGLAESHWGLRTQDGAPKPAYDVWLKHAKGQAAEAPQVPGVSLNTPPVAVLRVNVTGLVATFDASPSFDANGDALTYRIEFGDGASATGPRATRAYAAAGTYKATLTVSDGRANATTTATVVTLGAFSANFTGVTGNNYWVQTSATGNRAIASVSASVNGGAWQPLAAKSYGYAASFHVPNGSKVVFRATSVDGASVTSPAYSWPSAKLATTSTTTTATTTSTTSTATAPKATFTPYDGNTYWVQTKVASTQKVTSVCASLNGGACQTLPQRSWGAWANDIPAPTGTKVVFTAKLADGSTVRSSTYTWPVK
ncbi:MAG TPA: PKD domain-containing protein [Candidatus Thermoplasmatota archaeon]|nr:PKD domain-containing protein [Candidatus Thermoplasmatota archaeon]